MQAIKLQTAGLNELNLIGRLANRIWNQHYPAIIGQEQVDYMLGKMYSVDSLKKQLLESHRFFVIYQNETPIGFISLFPEKVEEWFISKFYIDQDLVGQGIGTMVFDQVLKLSEAKTFRLTVNRQNFKAINFYFKLGFKIEKVADFDIGEGYLMNDFVMLWKKV